MSKLFRKDIEPRCAYCRYSSPLDEKSVLCPKRGVTPMHEHCGRFRYDPLRRVPPRPASLNFAERHPDEDFSI